MNKFTDDVAAFLKKNKKVGYCKYTQNCTIYSFHIDDLRLRWLKTSNLEHLHICLASDRIQSSTLMFIIVSKNYEPKGYQPSFKHQILTKNNLKPNETSNFEDYLFNHNFP